MARSAQPISRRTKIIYTAMLNFSYFTYGIGINLIGTTIPDLRTILITDLSSVSYGISVRCVFYSISSLVCIWSFNRYNRQVQLALAFIFLGISLSLTPLSQNLSQYFVCSAVMGFVGAAIDIACNVWMLELWQENDHRYIQALNFFANLGTCLAPIVSNPFMVNRDNFDEVTTTANLTGDRSSFTPSACNQTNCGAHPLFPEFITGLPTPKEPEENRSQIEIPYAFIGVTLFITGILINLLYLCVPYSSPSSKRRNLRNDPLAEPIEVIPVPKRVRRPHFWIVLVFGSIVPCFYFSLCNNNYTYLQTFAMEIGYNKPNATLIYLIYSAVVAFACLCFMLLSTVLSPQLIIYLELIILLAADCVLLYLCQTNPQMIWLGICLLGFGISSIYPSLYSFIKQRIDVNNNVGSIVVFSGSLISVIFPILEGNYLQKYPNVFPLINLFATICILVLFTAMHSADFYYGFPLHKISPRSGREPEVCVTEFSTSDLTSNPVSSHP